jgi:hypothetical protein
VVLEVELPADRRQLVATLGDGIEEALARRLLDQWQAAQVGDPGRRLQHLRRRSATAVAVAEEDQARVAAIVVAEGDHRAPQLVGLELGVVGADRRQVGEHL